MACCDVLAKEGRGLLRAHHERNVSHTQLRRERLDVVLTVSLHVRQVLQGFA
jgi:hypothetical protein